MTDNLKCNCRNKNKERRTDIGGIRFWDHDGQSIDNTNFGELYENKRTYFEGDFSALSQWWLIFL
jgi:hypothetical protein